MQEGFWGCEGVGLDWRTQMGERMKEGEEDLKGCEHMGVCEGVIGLFGYSRVRRCWGAGGCGRMGGSRSVLGMY